MKTSIDFIEQRVALSPYVQMSTMIVLKTGRLVILNGGESAVEGGMGSGSKTEAEQGEKKPEKGKSGNNTTDIETENTFDPVKKDIEKKESEK